MARRSNNIEVAIVGDADFRAARREASRAFDRIENDGKDAADDIEKAFDRIDLDPKGADQFGDSLAAAGERGAEGITDAVSAIDFSNLGGSAADQFTGALAAAGPWAAAAGAVAVIFGDEFVAGFSQGFNRRRSEIMRAITTGASEAELATAGKAAGEAYTSGFGESLPELKADADRLVAILGDIVDEADFGPIVKQASLLSDVLGVDVPEAATLARRAVKQGLAKDVEDAFDDMIGVTQEFGQVGVEALDIYEEFGTNFANFEVDGGQAVRFVASAFEDGLIPTIDRAGEIFEEFTTRIVDADAADAIREIGLSFEDIQRDVAKGGEAANSAFKAVIAALQDYGTEADRSRLANVIFGQSFEQVGDEAELLRRLMLLLTDQTDAYAGVAQDATDSAEEAASGFERLQRTVEGLASTAGGLADNELRDLFTMWDVVAGAVETTADKLLFWRDAAEDAGDGSDEMAESIRFAAIEANALGDEAQDLAYDLDDASGSVSDLRNEFERLMGFQADDLMRNIESATDDAAEALSEADASAVGLNGSIDISTEAGRRLQGQMQDLSGALADAYFEMDEAGVSSGELAAAQRRAETAIRNAAAAAGLGAAETQGLIDRYLELIGLPNVDKTIQLTTYLNTIETTTAPRAVRGGSSGRSAPRRSSLSSGSNVIARRASGGPTTGMTLVGEEGPELADFGSRGGYVHNNRDTRRMISQAAGSFTGGRGAAPVVIRIESGGSRLDDVLVEMMRKAISNRGGGTVAVLG